MDLRSGRCCCCSDSSVDNPAPNYEKRELDRGVIPWNVISKSKQCRARGNEEGNRSGNVENGQELWKDIMMREWFNGECTRGSPTFVLPNPSRASMICEEVVGWAHTCTVNSLECWSTSLVVSLKYID